jgi:hypothetical protein
MINIDQLKQALEILPLSEDVKTLMINNSQILVEFRLFLAQKYSISEQEAESKITEDLSKLYDSKSKIDEISNCIEQYAKDQGFIKSEELKMSIVNLHKSLVSLS